MTWLYHSEEIIMVQYNLLQSQFQIELYIEIIPNGGSRFKDLCLIDLVNTKS